MNCMSFWPLKHPDFKNQAWIRVEFLLEIVFLQRIDATQKKIWILWKWEYSKLQCATVLCNWNQNFFIFPYESLSFMRIWLILKVLPHWWASESKYPVIRAFQRSTTWLLQSFTSTKFNILKLSFHELYSI